MNSKKLNKPQLLLLQLKKWGGSTKTLVIGLDGYSGIGKTTLANELKALLPELEVIHMDDYACTANTKEFLEPQLISYKTELHLMWKHKDGLKRLREHIKRFRARKNGGILLVEGIFLFHPEVLDDVWDKRIYLDGNMKRADTRRAMREKARFGKDYFPETHPDSFARLFKLAHRKYRIAYKPKSKADLIFVA